MTTIPPPNVAAFAAKHFESNFAAVLATGIVVPAAYTAPATQAFADWKVANANTKFYLVAGDQGGVSQLIKVANGGAKPQNAVEVDQDVAYGIESAKLSPTDWLMARIADEFRATSAAQSLGPALNQTPEPDLSFDLSSLDTASLRRLLKALGSQSDDEQRKVAIGNLADRRDALARLGLSRENLSIALDLQARFAEEAVAMQQDAVADNQGAKDAADSAAKAASAADAAAAAAADAAAKADPRSASLDKAAADAAAAAVTAQDNAKEAAAAFAETSARLAELPVFEKMVSDALAYLVTQSSSDMTSARTIADSFNVTRSAAGALNSTLQGTADRLLAQFDQVIAQFGSVLDLQQGTGAYVLNTASAQAREALVQLVKAELVKALSEPPRTQPMQSAAQSSQPTAALAGAIGVPVLLVAGAMGNLSTNDLLQVIRATARKTADALIVATMEEIKSQQANIRMKSADKIAQLNENITKLAEAEAAREKMEAMRIGMMILGGLIVLLSIIAAIASLGTASAASALAIAAVSTTMFAATTIMTEVKDDEGVSVMDKAMAKLAKAVAPAGSDDPEADGAAGATAIMVAIQVAIMLAIALATMGTGLPGAVSGMVSSVVSTVSSAASAAASMAARIASQTIMETVKMVAKAVLEAIKAVIAAAGEAAKAAVTAVKDSVNSVVAGVRTASAHVQMGGVGGAMRQMMALVKDAASNPIFVARSLSAASQATQAGMQIAQGANQMELAGIEQEISMGKAEVEKLKALIKYLEDLIKGEMEFVELIAQIQALLDKSVATLIRNEHGSNMKMEENRFSPAN